MHDVPEFEYIIHEHDAMNATGPFTIDCAFCHGTGVHPGTMNSLDHHRCPACRGKGTVHFPKDRSDYTTCRWCEGTGIEPQSTPVKACRGCHGHGII